MNSIPNLTLLIYICDKRFGRSFNLRRHIADIHGEENSDDNEENSVDESENVRSEVEHSEFEGDGSDEEVSSNELEDTTVYLEWLA